MGHKLQSAIERAFKLTHDLFTHLDEASLALDVPGVPSNRIADQVWCIVGARESYIAAIKKGDWQGFSCSLKTPRVKQSVLAALEATRADLAGIDFAILTDKALDLAFSLLEHEVQHHGQLIRYVCANELTFPKSWNERYTV
jgi:hypothetical protein